MNTLPEIWKRGLNDQFFNSMLEDFFGRPLRASGASLPTVKEYLNPNCEFTETADSYKFKFELAGFNKDQIKIDLHDNVLSVSGERKEERKDDSNKRHYSEMTYGSFSRTFTLPTKVDAERVEARYDNGLLNIDLKKASTTPSRQISVK